MSQPAPRLHALDLLRFLACSAVVAFHYLSRGPNAGWMADVSYPALEALAHYGYLGVHLFFVISGFVILMSTQGATPRDFVASRVARLYPALWAAATLTAATAWLLADRRFSISLPDFLTNLTMVPHWFGVAYVDGAYWSLSIELHFYIYVWLVLFCGQMHRVEWLLAAWLGVSALNAIRPAWPAEFWLDAKWAPLFVAGGLFFLVNTRGLTPRRGILLLASWFLAIFYAMREAAPSESLSPLICAGVITAIFALFLAISCGQISIRRSFVTAAAGALTYPAYLVHQNFGYMIYEQLQALTASTPVSLAVTIVIVILISWAIHRWVEKPAGRLLRRRIAGQASQQALVNPGH